MEAILEIQQSKKSTSIPIICGIVNTVFGLISNKLFFGIGIFLIIVGVTNRILKIITLYPQYLQVQLAFVRPKHYIKYEQITSFTIVGSNIVIQYKTENNTSKRVKIRVKSLEQEDLLELDKILQEKTELESTNTLNVTS